MSYGDDFVAAALASAVHSQDTAGSTTTRIRRPDGWTPDRIRTFLRALAQGATVANAAHAAGMSRQGAYAFRASPNGRSFASAWRAAQWLASRRRRRAVMARHEAKRRRRPKRYAPQVRRALASARELHTRLAWQAPR